MKKVLLLILSLAFCGSIFAQYEAHWQDIDYHLFNDHDPFVAMVSLDNHIILHEDNWGAYEVAAFVGEDEYRGHGFLKSYQNFGDLYPVLEFEIFYQPLENENEQPRPVYFKLYDHSTNTLYDYWTSTMDIVTQTQYNKYPSQSNVDQGLVPTISFFTTFTKVVKPYTENGGYYFIASPIGEVMAKDVINLRSNDFDFYSFDQNPDSGLEWVNLRDNEDYVLQPNVGYLYANSCGDNDSIILTFVGTPNYSGEDDVTLTLAREEGPNAEFPGWNLVGNPFAQKAYIDREEFYVMKSDGSEVITAEGNEIGAMEGIFVVAENDGEQVTFSTTPSAAKGQIVLNVAQNRGNVVDRAIVRFGQGGTLPKFMLNQSNTKMYISKDGNNYAVVRSNKSGELPVSFKAAQDGTYTISVNAENLNMRYLHLIDRFTGMDTDLLREPSYKFDAMTNDEASRFILVYKTNVFNALSIKGGNTEDFGFFSNGNWNINNEGDAILQVVDVNGRILSSEEISGSVSKRIEAAPGVFMLRLINGKDMKVQKIVVE